MNRPEYNNLENNSISLSCIKTIIAQSVNEEGYE